MSTQCIDYADVFVFDDGRLLDTLQIPPGSKQGNMERGGETKFDC